MACLKHTNRLALSGVFLLLISMVLPTAASVGFAAATDFGIDSSGHFITKSARPIFLLGDTVWPLAVRFNDEQIRAYLDNTRQLGFNVIALFETTTWAAYDEHGKNVFGQLPFRNRNPWQLNEKYWQRYKFVIREAAKRDIYGIRPVNPSSA